MKKILFPTEFANHTPQVFRYAVALAEAFNAEILMLHAINLELNPSDTTSFDDRAAQAIDQMIAFKEAVLLPKMEHIKVEYSTEIGFAADVIKKVAKREGIDLIVMGMQGQTNAKAKYLGTVATEMMEHAHCPVLMIPSTADFKGLHRLACTTNFDFQDLTVLATLKTWAKKFSAKIKVIHVAKDREALPVAQHKIKLLETLFGDNFQFQIHGGEVIDSIEDFVSYSQVDLLAMMHHQHHFLSKLIREDVTNEIAKDVQVPLLVFNEE